MDISQLEVTVQQLKQAMDGGGTYVLDVRTPAEHEANHIAGTAHIPLDQLPMKWQSIPNDRPVLIYCKSGGRSLQAAMYLLQQGLEDVKSVRGGIIAWDAEIE